ncbi:MAG TPA: phosphomannomutase/phosphoglucomutase [Chthonomonadales bacterium]|nr:phosphomannomutase/phosphoglucomutase [Chthonomonadales bacterium]
MGIFKACDIRGPFGTELTVEHARLLAHAIAFRQDPSVVLVGGDGRASTPALRAALIAAFVECGVRVTDLGEVPTPAFYHARRRLGIKVGVMVTASHNPPGDNGFKLTLGDMPITEAELHGIRALMEADIHSARPRPGAHTRYDIMPEYRQHIRTVCAVDGALRVAIDASNGMLGPVAPGVFRDLGFDVLELYTTVDGTYPNHLPNPAVFDNLRDLSALVREHGCDLGIAYDGDGDRAGFVDETGAPVDNDRAIVLFARDALSRSPRGRIVYDQKCSDVVREEIIKAGGYPRLEKSGYTFIKAALLRSGAAYAGELSGHHFFGEIGGDDALIASLRMAALLQRSGRKMSELVAGVPRYATTPDIRLPVGRAEAEAILLAVSERLASEAEVTEIDGVRARFADGWGLVRASVTEAAITLRFEGRTPEALQRVKDAFVRAAPQLAGRI